MHRINLSAARPGLLLAMASILVVLFGLGGVAVAENFFCDTSVASSASDG